MKLNPPHGAKKVSRLKGTAMNHSSFVSVPHAIRRGDIFYADLSPVVGSEQGGIRPVLIVQNDVGNRHSPTVIAAAIQPQPMRVVNAAGIGRIISVSAAG